MCPLCDPKIEDNEDGTQTFADTTFNNATEYAKHILKEHPLDNRTVWAKHHLEYLDSLKKQEQNAVKNYGMERIREYVNDKMCEVKPEPTSPTPNHAPTPLSGDASGEPASALLDEKPVQTG
jgi:hypothetical protein